ncbi:MAG: succinyl-diaminopimelate desuccinylase [Candidatus Krumholzibacteriota bacterium]|jgi:succinyl-diaminopimelate desuccinylase|nr:succinyl-diaminopimelate desuccinylase [Candidatus Krumholzibacteriota bacterium]
MDKNLLAQLTKRIDGYAGEVVRLQTELCKLPALGPESGGEGELRKAEFLEGYMKSIGFRDIKHIDAPDTRVPCGFRRNMAATIPGASTTSRLWVMTHMDVVPPGDLNMWTGDPWTVRVEGDKIIGRGCEDNQQGMISSLLAAKAFHEAGIEPRLPYGVVLVSDEETGNALGAGYVVKTQKDLFRKSDMIIIPDAGNPKGTMLEVAEKSILWIKFQTKGKQTHGSTPDKGANAHKASCYMVSRLESLYKKFGKKSAIFDPPMSTFEPTKKEANVPNVNTIPGEDVVYFDCRVLPNYKLADVIKAVTQIARETERRYKVKIAVTLPQKQVAAPPTAVDAPVVKAITAAMKDLRKRTPKAMGIGGGTVAKFFRDKGYPCAVWGTQDEVAHSPDEYSKLSATLADAKAFAHIALQDW